MQGRTRTIVAIDPAARGVAFVVLEAPPAFIVDWGLRGTRVRTERDLLAVVLGLVERYAPDTLVVEDAGKSRRGRRSIALINAIERLATREGVPCRRISRQVVQRSYQLSGARTSYEIAMTLADRFPELLLILPPKRKVYMSEDERMHIFSALALGLAVQPRSAESVGPVEATS